MYKDCLYPVGLIFKHVYTATCIRDHQQYLCHLVNLLNKICCFLSCRMSILNMYSYQVRTLHPWWTEYKRDFQFTFLTALINRSGLIWWGIFLMAGFPPTIIEICPGTNLKVLKWDIQHRSKPNLHVEVCVHLAASGLVGFRLKTMFRSLWWTSTNGYSGYPWRRWRLCMERIGRTILTVRKFMDDAY